MKHIKIQTDEPLFSSTLLDFYFSGMKIGVLDIETTGLNPSRNKFILGGLFTFEDKVLHQFFAESRSEEKETLEAYLTEISKLDMVITYNGKHFDMPFLAKRAQAHGINVQLSFNLDLYLMLNGHSPIKKFVPNLKQKTVENYMGLWETRADEISGGESVELYNTYESTHDPQLEEKILLHNSDDVLQLTRLLKVITKCDFHKAMFTLGFPVSELTVQKVKIEGDFMTVTGIQSGFFDAAVTSDHKQNTGAIDYMGFFFGDYPVETRFESKENTFEMKFPVIRDSGLCFVDASAAGLDCTQFEKYPTYSSGFLVLENRNTRNFMEINHFIKSFIELFIKNI